MSWMNMLYQTYENNKAMAGKAGENVTLSVIAHAVVNAQLEITLNNNGEFVKADIVDKDNCKTLIPVTEASASRSSGIAPHALSDTLSYIAGDYSSYINDPNIIDKCDNKFKAYFSQLRNWKESGWCSQKINIIYKYISKKSMMSDLINIGLVKCDENGYLTADKIMQQPYEKVMVKFIVLDDNGVFSTWEDTELLDKYTSFYLENKKGREDVCYITGKKEVLSNNHPKGIIQANYGAKLISANDTTNFTYRGRFIDSDEACTISYEATQKAHNALSWLAAKQGVTVGTKDKRTYICWNPKGKPVPDFEDEFSCCDEDEISISYTDESFRKKLWLAVNGYSKKLNDSDDIVVIGLDAATTGRLSVTYYNELKASDYLERLRTWNDTCHWFFPISYGKKEVCVATPLAKNIVRCIYGTERGNFLEVDDKILKEQSQRIYCCILDGQPIPLDMVHYICERASRPLTYSQSNYAQVLSTACALLYKKDIERKEGKITMKLDLENEDRSYLFGRILAIEEAIEMQALRTQPLDSERPTNAMRLHSEFVNHPMHTFEILEKAMVPYYNKLIKDNHRGSYEMYKSTISEIIGKILAKDEKMLNKSLDDIYLIGYYLQRKELIGNKKNQEEKKED